MNANPSTPHIMPTNPTVEMIPNAAAIRLTAYLSINTPITIRPTICDAPYAESSRPAAARPSPRSPPISASEVTIPTVPMLISIVAPAIRQNSRFFHDGGLLLRSRWAGRSSAPALRVA